VATLYDFRTLFPGWFKKESKLYIEHRRYWDPPYIWNHPNRTDKRGTTSLLVDRPFTDHTGNTRMVPVLTLFYEDFVKNLAETSKQMLEFIQTKSLGQAMPPAETSVVCALSHMSSVTADKRSHAARKYNPYTDPKGGIAAQKLVADFCHSVRNFWFAEKWGDCLSAPLQSNRDQVITLPPKLPTEVCQS